MIGPSPRLQQYYYLPSVSIPNVMQAESPCPMILEAEHLYDASSELSKLQIVRLGLFKLPPWYLLPSITIISEFPLLVPAVGLNLVQKTLVAAGLDVQEQGILIDCLPCPLNDEIESEMITTGLSKKTNPNNVIIGVWSNVI